MYSDKEKNPPLFNKNGKRYTSRSRSADYKSYMRIKKRRLREERLQKEQNEKGIDKSGQK